MEKLTRTHLDGTPAPEPGCEACETLNRFVEKYEVTFRALLEEAEEQGIGTGLILMAPNPLCQSRLILGHALPNMHSPILQLALQLYTVKDRAGLAEIAHAIPTVAEIMGINELFRE